MKTFIQGCKLCVLCIPILLFFVSCDPSEEVIVEVESISMDEPSVELLEGASKTLTVTITPSDATDKTVAWHSSDDGVATVQNGVLETVSPGTMTVTVKTSNGKSATCFVTVSRKTIEVESIELDKGSMELVSGTSSTLKVTIKPVGAAENPVTWESSNTQVAVVDGKGVVTAVGIGTADITASAGARSATCVVTVTPVHIKITNIAVKPSTHTMGVGEEIQLSAEIHPANSTSRGVLWYSKDIVKATVNPETGLVKALAAGRVAIVAVTEESENIVDSCVIVINPAYVPVENIVLDKAEITLTEGGKDRIKATITPSGATNPSIRWTSEHPDIATVDGNGNITAISAGITTIKAEADGKSASCLVTVKEQEGQAVHFPDQVFEAFLLNQYDRDGNGILSTAEVSDVTRLDCRTQRITSLDGLEYFSSLETLICRDNQIAVLDVSRNLSLKYVDCRNNKINVLDVSLLVNLEDLNCDENLLEEIIVENNTLLKNFSCAVNRIENLDVSYNPDLYNLNCSSNRLTAIDVSHNKKLSIFLCSGNSLSAKRLDVSKNDLLNILYCASCGLEELHLGNNPKLTTLVCDNNNLQALNLSRNDRLSILYCHHNKISGDLDLSLLKSIERFDCTSNRIGKLYISPELKALLDAGTIKEFGYDSSVLVEVK